MFSVRSRSVAVAAAVVLTVTGVLGTPAHAAAPTSADRSRCVELLLTGGPAVTRAAEAALTGTDAALTAFLSTGYAQAKAWDDQVRLEQLRSLSGPVTRAAAQTAIN